MIIANLHYLIGDVLLPIKKPSLLIHCCNDVGKWGKGFVVALSGKYPLTKEAYLKWFATEKPRLGDVQFVQVAPDICIANMIAQHDIKYHKSVPPIRYAALRKCLEKSYEKAQKENLTVHAPRLGAALAGGDWSIVEGILKQTMIVETYIYTLPDEINKWPKANYGLKGACL